MLDSNIIIAKEWFLKLREKLINNIENIETEKFIISEWKHQEEGGDDVVGGGG